MRKYFAIAVLAAVIAGMGACNTKKEPAVGEQFKFNPAACSTFAIRVTPEKSEDPQITIASGRELTFEATALDRNGKPINAPLTWSFRYPDGGNEQHSGGHELAAKDDRRAAFRATGLAPGVFTVVVQDRSCNQAVSDEPQYPEGEAWVKVYEKPDARAACGRMRVTYGDRIDRNGDTILASAKVTLIAEVSGREKLGRKYRVKFFVNGKSYAGLRPLYRDPEVRPLPGMEAGHFAMLPLYLVPGDYSVRYELDYAGEPVCGSRTERFRAK
ncbi:MAG TPA: hypothetical protein VM658_19480 [bacterium]|nr:hypothetical protein [bacterium]